MCLCGLLVVVKVCLCVGVIGGYRCLALAVLIMQNSNKEHLIFAPLVFVGNSLLEIPVFEMSNVHI